MIGKDERKDRQPGQDGDQGIGPCDDHDIAGNRVPAVEIGAIDHDRAHAQAQAEEGLPHGAQDALGAQPAEIGPKQIGEPSTK